MSSAPLCIANENSWLAEVAKKRSGVGWWWFRENPSLGRPCQVARSLAPALRTSSCGGFLCLLG